jgi:hypothetical protein
VTRREILHEGCFLLSGERSIIDRALVKFRLSANTVRSALVEKPDKVGKFRPNRITTTEVGRRVPAAHKFRT